MSDLLPGRSSAQIRSAAPRPLGTLTLDISHSVAGLFAVLGLALLLRSYDLLSFPMFTDEAIYLQWARDIWEQRTRAALLIPIADDGKQPLFMWLAGGAMQFSGDPLLAGRLVSSLAGVITTLGVYVLGRQLSNHRVGLLAALLYAVVPFSLVVDRMALADGMVNMQAVWVLALSVLMATTATSRRRTVLLALCLGVVLGAAIWTKMTGLFLLAFPVLSLLVLGDRRRLGSFLAGITLAYSVFGLFGVLLALMPDAENLVNKTSHFSLSPAELLTFPIALWSANASAYWGWMQSYLPAPLYWIVLAAIPWGLAFQPRRTLLLVGCWAACTLPTMLTAKMLFVPRYILPGLFPLLLMSADFAAAAWDRLSARLPSRRFLSDAAPVRAWVAGACLLSVIAVPSLLFDLRLLTDPGSSALVEADRDYQSGWPSGFGFAQALDLVRERVAFHDREVIVLSDHYHGLPYDGLRLYLAGAPRTHLYVDRHVISGNRGILDAWESHRVPLLIVGNDGRDNLESFEASTPEAKRIGMFWKPDGQGSFRVYEIDLAQLPGAAAGGGGS